MVDSASTQASAAALASYGIPPTFMPTVTPTNIGDWAVTYSTQFGFAQQIGNLVFVYVNVTFTPTFTTASGNLVIGLGSMPVTNVNGANAAFSLTTIGASFTWPASTTQVISRFTATGLLLLGAKTGANPVVFTPSNLTSGSSHALGLSGTFNFAPPQ